MTVDLLVTNGKLLLPSGIFSGALAIDEGKIVKIGKEGRLPRADRRLDLKGLIAIPGAIDAHVHFWDPGFEYREDWASGTHSAASGGITTVVNHPYDNKPPMTNLRQMIRKKRIAEKSAVIDFAFYAGAKKGELSDLVELLDAGCLGAKFFMSEFNHFDDYSLLAAFRLLATKHRPALVHAENEGIIRSFRQVFIEQGKRRPKDYPKARPSLAEEEATFRAICLAKIAGCSLYVVHVSTPAAMRHIKQAKHQGYPIYAESCPQYLLLDDSRYGAQGPYACMNPPLRSKKEVSEMWRYLRDRTIDVIASDHSPYPKYEKERAWKNIWLAAPGAPGIETMLPVLLDQVNRGSLTLRRLVDLVCYKPARILGLYPRKGVIAVGSDGDLTIIDLRKTARISSDGMHTKGEFTLFEGKKVRGVPVSMLLRGNIIMDNGYPGEIIANSGIGRFVPACI